MTVFRTPYETLLSFLGPEHFVGKGKTDFGLSQEWHRDLGMNSAGPNYAQFIVRSTGHPGQS